MFLLWLVFLGRMAAQQCTAEQEAAGTKSRLAVFNETVNSQHLYIPFAEPVNRQDPNSDVMIMQYNPNRDEVYIKRMDNSATTQLCSTTINFWNLRVYDESLIFNDTLFVVQNYNTANASRRGVLRKFSVDNCTEIDHVRVPTYYGYVRELTFFDDNGDFRILLTQSNTNRFLILLVYDFDLNLLYSKETNLVTEALWLHADYDTGPLATKWCAQASVPCENTNLLILFAGSSKVNLLKVSVTLNIAHWNLEFDNSETIPSCIMVDRDTNKVYVVNIYHNTSNTVKKTFLYKIANEDGTSETSYMINGIGTSDSPPRLRLYDGKLMLITSDGEIFYIRKDTLSIISQYSISSSENDFRMRFEHIVGDYMYAGGTYRDSSSISFGVYYKTRLPYFNDIEESVLNFVVSTASWSISNITSLPTFITPITLSAYTVSSGTEALVDLGASFIVAKIGISVAQKYYFFPQTDLFYCLQGEECSFNLSPQACVVGASSTLTYRLLDNETRVEQISGIYANASVSSSGIVGVTGIQQGNQTHEYDVIAPDGQNLIRSSLQLVIRNCSLIQNCEQCQIDSLGNVQCTQCAYPEYELDSEQNSCIVRQISSFSDTSTKVVQGAVGAQLAAVTVLSMVGNQANTQVVWKIVNHFQNLMLLICLQVMIPYKYTQTLVGFQVMMFDFRPLVPLLDEYFEYLKKWFGSENKVLKQFNDTGFDYFSVFINYNTTFLFAMLGVLFHMVSTPIYNHTDKRMLKCSTSCVVRIYEGLTFGFYIRVIFEMALFMILNSVLETIGLYHKIKDGKPFGGWVASNVFAILSIIFYVAFTIIIYIKLKTSRRKVADKDSAAISNFELNEMNIVSRRLNFNKFGELRSGLKIYHSHHLLSKLAYYYQLIFMLRRFMMVGVIAAFIGYRSQTATYVQESILLVMQLVFLGYIIPARPFKQTENNVIEVLNEFVFLFLIICTFALPSDSSGPKDFVMKYDMKEEVMTTTVIASALVVSLISISWMVAVKIKEVFNRCKTKRKTLYVPSSCQGISKYLPRNQVLANEGMVRNRTNTNEKNSESHLSKLPMKR
ncbi:unnamed protein product [Moneuplotes crassus]|uniref:Uncharacterized protein n=1 Tax=Euplotes crassus TaxID=5936 RepID=A0AAD1XIS6_EUPCR|nr:unnamed protein product [Moneuplotes crassus]